MTESLNHPQYRYYEGRMWEVNQLMERLLAQGEPGTWIAVYNEGYDRWEFGFQTELSWARKPYRDIPEPFKAGLLLVGVPN